MPAVARYNTRSPSLAESAVRHRPWLRNCCTICLGLDHQRSHCIYLTTQRKLRYSAARYKEPEPTRKQPASTSISLPLRRGGSSRAFTRSDSYATAQIPRKGSFQTFKVQPLIAPTTRPKAAPVVLEPTNKVPRCAEHCPYDKKYHALKSEQSRLHEKLCGGRCAEYGHQDGACGSVPCEDFEKVHVRQLEREAARRSKAEARIFGGARRGRALAWKPRVMKHDYDGYFDLDFKRSLSVSGRTFQMGSPGQSQDEITRQSPSMTRALARIKKR